jgi:hypothetical protein
MTHRQMIQQLIGIAIAGLVLWLMIAQRLRVRHTRQRLVTDGVLPAAEASARVRWKMWLFVVPAGLLGLLMARGVSTLEPRLGYWATRCTVFGAAFFVVWVVVYARMVWQRDRLVASAMRLAKAGQSAAAIELLRDAHAREPSDRRAAALAALYAKTGDHAEAAARFAEAYRLAPTRPVYVVGQVIALNVAGRNDEALAAVEAARAAYPAEAALFAAAAVVLQSLGRAEEAAERLRQAEELGRAAGDDRRIDFVTGGQIFQLARQRVTKTPGRGFQVTIPDPSAG